MDKMRLRFSKLGPAAYISHLDLMRTFQRIFTRARLPVWHTEGFNPHPYLSVLSPLSTGYEGEREFLDFILTEKIELEEAVRHINEACPEGLRAHRAYPAEMMAGKIAYGRYAIQFYAGEGFEKDAGEAVQKFFSRGPVLVEKRSKKGIVTTLDLSEHIRELEVKGAEDRAMHMEAVLPAGAVSVNPEHLAAAARESGVLKFDSARYRRTCLYTADMEAFR